MKSINCYGEINRQKAIAQRRDEKAAEMLTTDGRRRCYRDVTSVRTTARRSRSERRDAGVERDTVAVTQTQS